MSAPAHILGILFDLDGTIYLGGEALPGAVETVMELRRRGKRVLFASNKTLESSQAYAAKLNNLGITASEDDVLTPGNVLGAYLSKHHPGINLYVIGEDNIRAELLSYGLAVLPEFWDQDAMQVIKPHGVDAVVVAGDRTLDYRKINTAYQALVAGACFIATNPDNTCPVQGGEVPDAGATLAMLERMTGRQVDLLAGKPSALMMETALAKMGVTARHCMVVGDMLETDIRAGQQAGMVTALVLTGVVRRENLTGLSSPPDYVLDNLSQLLEIVD